MYQFFEVTKVTESGLHCNKKKYLLWIHSKFYFEAEIGGGYNIRYINVLNIKNIGFFENFFDFH